MDANTWIWVALIAFLVFCCLPMLFMGRHDKGARSNGRTDRRDTSGGGGHTTP